MDNLGRTGFSQWWAEDPARYLRSLLEQIRAEDRSALATLDLQQFLLEAGRLQGEIRLLDRILSPEYRMELIKGYDDWRHRRDAERGTMLGG